MPVVGWLSPDGDVDGVHPWRRCKVIDSAVSFCVIRSFREIVVGMATSVSRPYQIVVWGATGFVGRLVCERLAAEYPVRHPLSSADAQGVFCRAASATCGHRRAQPCQARISSPRDDAVRYGVSSPSIENRQASGSDAVLQEVPILVADSADRDAIDAVTQSTEVVISCAGPYRKYSGEVVASSAANGTHYLDLCGRHPDPIGGIADGAAVAAAAQRRYLSSGITFDAITRRPYRTKPRSCISVDSIASRWISARCWWWIRSERDTTRRERDTVWRRCRFSV